MIHQFIHAVTIYEDIDTIASSDLSWSQQYSTIVSPGPTINLVLSATPLVKQCHAVK